MSNEVNPAYSAVFQSDCVATYKAKERDIKPLGLGIERHLDEVGFHTHVIPPYKVMKTPPWKLIVRTVCFNVCKYNTRRVKLIQLYIVCVILNFWNLTDYTHIFTDGSKDGDKTGVAFICPSFKFSKRLPDKTSIFTSGLKAIVSALHYIESTTKRKKFVIFGDSKSALQALLSNHATKPLIEEQPSAYRSVPRAEVVLCRLRLGHSYLTHSYLLKGEPPPECVTCKCYLTISHILVDFIEYDFCRLILFENNFTLTYIFNNLSPNKII